MKPAPVKSSVSIEALEQLDIRVGTILSVEDVPESRKPEHPIPNGARAG
jgi:tRNA-binding EMAP/Myf-like protein